jgi:DeoR/GlpR family transcriptional regulator of sugar metabolism
MMLLSQRRQAILDLTVRDGSIDVEKISSLFGISNVTARSDLDFLAGRHLVERTRGGAVAALQRSLAADFEERSLRNRDEKRRIAKLASEMLAPDETVILDAGSTIVELCRYISSVMRLTIITPALNIATELGSLSGLEVLIVGGRLDSRMISSVGGIAERQLHECLAHKVFLGAHMIDADGDIADISSEVADVKRAMVRSARQVILLADSSKWNSETVGKYKVTSLGSVDVVVTDKGLTKSIRADMERDGIRVSIA